MRRVRRVLAAAALAGLAAACATPGPPAEPRGLVFEAVRIDPQGLIAPDLLSEALASYAKHRGTVAAQTRLFVLPTKTIESRVSPIRRDVMAVVDFRLPSSTPRLFVIDLADGSVEVYRIAHGRGSGEGPVPTLFSNLMDSLTSSVGAYVAANIYEDGFWPGSMRLHGLDPTNSCAFWRAIVMHEAAYMTPKPGTGAVGTSDGCLAVSQADRRILNPRLADGAFIYAGPAALHTRTPADGMSSQSACEAVRLRPELGPQPGPDAAEPSS